MTGKRWGATIEIQIQDSLSLWETSSSDVCNIATVCLHVFFCVYSGLFLAEDSFEWNTGLELSLTGQIKITYNLRFPRQFGTVLATEVCLVIKIKHSTVLGLLCLCCAHLFSVVWIIVVHHSSFIIFYFNIFTFFRHTFHTFKNVIHVFHR